MTTNQNFPNEFLKLWQKGMQDYMQDAKAAELVSDYFLKFQENYNSMMNPNGKNSSSEFHDDGAKRDEQYLLLADRMQQLEQRIAKLESSAKPKRAAA